MGLLAGAVAVVCGCGVGTTLLSGGIVFTWSEFWARVVTGVAWAGSG